jgi:protein TonB
MFELIAKSNVRPLQERSPGSRIAAIVAHAIALMAVLALPAFHAVGARPEVPTILTFVATPLSLSTPAPPAAPGTPTPPPPPARSAGATPRPVDTVREPPTPAEASSDIQPEPVSTRGVEGPAGVEGRNGEGAAEGSASGINGGLVGGVATLPPPPPPKPATATAPVRVGGPIKVPSLIKRVDPVYSPVAAAAALSGLVILEAVVDVNGSVDSVKVLHGGGALLDNAAIEALKEWKYSPLVLNGVPTPFLVTVTFNFRIG